MDRDLWIKGPGQHGQVAMDQGARDQVDRSHGSRGPGGQGAMDQRAKGQVDRQAMYRRTRGQLDREPWIKGPGARWRKALSKGPGPG